MLKSTNKTGSFASIALVGVAMIAYHNRSKALVFRPVIDAKVAVQKIRIKIGF